MIPADDFRSAHLVAIRHVVGVKRFAVVIEELNRGHTVWCTPIPFPTIRKLCSLIIHVIANVAQPVWKLGAEIGREHPLEEVGRGKAHSEAKSHRNDNASRRIEERYHLTGSSNIKIVYFRLKNSVLPDLTFPPV